MVRRANTIATEDNPPGTFGRFWATMGILMGAATLISMAKATFSIEFSTWPQAVFDQYKWFRETIFLPVEHAFHWVGLRMPSLLKDGLLAYFLVGGAMLRSVLATSGIAIARGRTFKHMLKQPILIAIKWPRSLIVLWPFTLYHYARYPSGRNYGAKVYLGWNYFFDWMYQIGLAVAACALFLLWNFILGKFGPPLQ